MMTAAISVIVDRFLLNGSDSDHYGPWNLDHMWHTYGMVVEVSRCRM